MLCCFACQQGHFWSFILLIPTGGPCILNSKVSTHFCLLAHVCQHTFFLTHSTLNYNSTQMLAKSPFSQSVSYTRMSLRYSLTELISLFFIIVTSVITKFKHSSLLPRPLHSHGWCPASGCYSVSAHEVIFTFQ